MRNIPLASTVLAVALLAAIPAQAQTVSQNVGDFYVGAGAGASIPFDLNVSGGGVTGHLSFDTGASGSIFGGYHVNDYLAVELQLGYASVDTTNIAASTSFASTNAAVDGTLDTFTAFSNVIVTPLGRSGFSPYFGGGIGVANTRLDISSIGGFSSGQNSNETDFAANGLAGFDYYVTDRLTIGARYQFEWIDLSSSSGASTDGYMTNVITGNLNYRF